MGEDDTCYFEFTRKLKVLEASSALEQNTDNPETFGATSGIKAQPFVKARARWTQRVFSWFKRG